MQITKQQLRQIIKEALQEELNEASFLDWAKRMFGIAKPTEDSSAYITRIVKAMENPRFKGHAFPIGKCRTGNYCPEKNCSPLCGKSWGDMKKRISSYAQRAVVGDR